VNVRELIEELKQMPPDAPVVGQPTSLGTYIPIRLVGTFRVIPVYGRLTVPEYVAPINAKDRADTARRTFVIIE